MAHAQDLRSRQAGRQEVGVTGGRLRAHAQKGPGCESAHYRRAGVRSERGAVLLFARRVCRHFSRLCKGLSFAAAERCYDNLAVSSKASPIIEPEKGGLRAYLWPL